MTRWREIPSTARSAMKRSFRYARKRRNRRNPICRPPDREEKAKQRKAGENVMNTVSGAFHSWRDRCKAINEVPAPDSRLKKWALGYVNRDGSFKNPLLSTIFYYAGIGFLVISAIIVVVRIFLDIAEGKCTNHPEGYITAAVFFADAFFNFGIAQVIHCIGKQAYNTDKIVEILTNTKDRE